MPRTEKGLSKDVDASFPKPRRAQLEVCTLREPEHLHEIRSPTVARAHLGVIDVGSNAIRIQVARVFDDGSFSVIHDERDAVRLGEEVFRTGKLSDEAINRALITLKQYSLVANQYGTMRIRSVATSAVREAQNAQFFIEEVEKATGLRLEVISGTFEAQLIAKGVLSSCRAWRGRTALVDIGGGSTEISVVNSEKLIFSQSAPLGSVRLTEMYCASDPILLVDERNLREYVRNHLKKMMAPIAMEPCNTVVGSAGTIGALANFIRRQPSGPRQGSHTRTAFSVHELARASAALRKMSLEKRRKTPGIEERRAEIVVAGAILLEEICKFLKARTIRVVRRGLRDGLMLEEVERLAKEGAIDISAAPWRRT